MSRGIFNVQNTNHFGNGVAVFALSAFLDSSGVENLQFSLFSRTLVL